MYLQEYIQWVGCWLYMAFWFGIESRRYWCSATTPSMAKVSLFILNRIMSRKQFDYILSAIHFTNRQVPNEDGLFQMRQLEESRNQNIAQQFLPSWINVLDESMMEWFNKWALGLIYVGLKPHPFENQWHTIYCALASILWRAHIVAVKDRRTQLCKKKWEELGKTVGLMLQICEPMC